MPKPANHTQPNRQMHWLIVTAVVVCAFAAALVLYSIATEENYPGLRAQSESTTRPPVTVIPRPPVEIHEDADETAPSPDGGQRTIVAPPIPNYPTGSILGAGSVALDWDDVPTAQGYVVRVYTGTVWTHLPANGITIEFSGSNAQTDCNTETEADSHAVSRG